VTIAGKPQRTTGGRSVHRRRLFWGLGSEPYTAAVINDLDAVEWAQLLHAYGSAADVPGQLRDLAAADDDGVREMLGEVFASNLVHQGTRFEATAYAVPFLAELAGTPTQAGRHRIVSFLTYAAVGYRHNRPGSFPVAQERAWAAADHAAGGVDELREQVRSWLLTPRPERGRRPVTSAQIDRLQRHTGLVVYDAVRSQLGVLGPLLRNPDTQLAGHTALLLSWFPQDAADDASALVEMACSAGPSSVAALIALGAMEPVLSWSEAGVAILERLADPNRDVRWAAATAAVRWYGPTAPPAAVEVLREHARDEDNDPTWPWGINAQWYTAASLAGGQLD
jgi:hypothetical protein